MIGQTVVTITLLIVGAIVMPFSCEEAVLIESYRSSPRNFFDIPEIRQRPRGTCERPPDVKPPDDDVSKLTLWELLEKTESQLELHGEDAIFLLGNTGSGKSTIALTVAGNLSALHVYETAGEELIIVDDDQKIGIGTESRTLIPELIVDPVNNLYYYDCPGFSDTRGTNADITANYLLMKLTENVASIRLVFTVIESAIKAGNDRTYFDYLVTSATQLVRNLEKLDKAIGMIVTKVVNINRKGQIRENDTILAGIVEYLTQYIQDQEKQIGQDPQKDDIIKRKIRFVQILLQEGRIWFFRQPDECGPFTESTFAQESKDDMIRLMRDNLTAVFSKPEDFAFAVTADTLVGVYSLYAQLNDNVTSDMASLVQRLDVAHFQTSLTIKDFYDTKSYILNDIGNFTSVINQLVNSTSPREFGETMHTAVVNREYDQRWGLNFKNEMEKIESYMNFFDEVAKNGQAKLTREPSKWKQPLESWLEKLSKRGEWYEFLKDLRLALAGYSFQKKDKPSTPPSNIRELKTLLGKDDGEFIKESTIEIYESKIGIVDQDIDIMWELVNEALEKVDNSCTSTGETLIVKGTFVKVKDFTNSDGSYVQCSGKDPVLVKVFATRTIFIDRDIKPKLGNDLNKELAFVAPVWEVVEGVEKNEYKFDLDGMNGVKPSGYIFDNWVRNPNKQRGIVTKLPWAIANDCDRKGPVPGGADGSRGKPGNPGHPGGNFVGMTEEVTNGKKLTVSVNGGDGSDGVNGENGKEGTKGKPRAYSEWGICHNVGPCLGGKFPDCPSSPGECQGSKFTGHFDRCHRKVSKVVDCIAAGCLGGTGGNGGDGGARGSGANAGNVELVNVGEEGSLEILQHKSAGGNGNDGAGGWAGQGGQRGDGNVAGVHHTTNCACYWEDVKSHTSTDRSPGGSNGITGKVTEGQSPPRQPVFKLNHLQLVLEYKQFVIPKQSDYFKDDFITRLEYAPSTVKEHSPIRFAQELLILEQINLEMRNNKVERDTMTLRMLPRYDSFLDRVDKYTESQTRSLADNDRKLLSLLYSTALNQARIMKQVYGSPVIVNVAGYLQTVDKRLKLYDETSTAVMIDEERERYKSTFYEKIEQAMIFLVETVDPALTETYAEIEVVTEELLKAIEKLIEEAEAQEQAYKDALEKMKKQMVIRDLFTIFKVGGTALSILGGPIGGAVGGMIGTGVAIGEQLAMDNGNQLRPPTPLPPSIQKYADQMEAKSKALSKERQQEIDTLLIESIDAVADNKEAMHQIQPYNTQLEKDREELIEKGEKGTLKQFQDLNKKVEKSEEELKTQLGKRATDLEKEMNGQAGTPEEQEIAKKHGQKAIDSINHIKNTVKVVSDLGFATYNKYKNDRNEIARISAMVDEAARQVEALNKYKEAVNGILVPFTDAVIQDLDAYAQQMANQSSVFLRVQRWNVQKTLREYNFFLQDFSQAFPDIAKQYAYQVESLQEAMTLMIDLYDFIEQYNEQMQFADYIANINSPRALKAVLGEEAATLYAKIEQAMYASIILVEWDRVIQTFEQWVFPFANVFQADLQTSGIPDYLAPEITSSTQVYAMLIPEISKRVNELILALKTYESAIFTPIDDELILTEFNSNKVSTVPFHVWSPDTKEFLIKEFLLGNQVTFSASPSFTYKLGMSAVKLTIVEIEPKSKDENIQGELLKKLNNLRIRLTHSGVSRYLYEDSETAMVGGNLTIQYNFERDLNNKRLGTNAVYKKLENGDLILSPYTLWTAQLFKVHENIDFDFKEFAKLASAVDVELIGKGSFVRPRGTRLNTGRLPLYLFRLKRQY